MGYLEQVIPANASVSALDYWDSHLDHRTHIYVWPAPFIPSNWGLPSNATATLPPAQSVTYLVLPTHLSPAQNADVFARIRADYRVLRQADDITLYERIK